MTTPGPYLTPGPAAGVPDGWCVLPAGVVDGLAAAAVFNPDLHDVCRTDRPFGPDVADAVTKAGWTRAAVTDTGGEVWLRDRATASRHRLALHRGCARQPLVRSRR